MEKILCPVDLQTDTLNALEAGARVAVAHKAQLVLLHVFTNSSYERALLTGAGDLREVETAEQEKMAALDSLGRTLEDAIPGLPWQAILREGSTVDVILDEAKSLKASLIVMGSHGVASITEAMDGNHPVKVIEQAPCPVLCVPEGAQFEVPARVMYGSRMKAEDPDCLQRLLAFLHPFSSRIDVVHVGEDTAHNIQRWTDHEQLIRSYVPYEKMRFHFFPWKKDAFLGLAEYQMQTGGELLVLLTHQRNYLQRLFDKSVFKQFTYYSDFPVLVYLEDHLASTEATDRNLA